MDIQSLQSQLTTDYWHQLETAQKLIELGQVHECKEIIIKLHNSLNDRRNPIIAKRLYLLEMFIRTYELDFDSSRFSSFYININCKNINEYILNIIPGISVVTCCMNRFDNLNSAIPSWLQFSCIDEIVIVDWSSKVPVSDQLFKAGYDDPRIKIIRVENEERWILSYAFNIGFRAARFDKILKLDADIILDKHFFENNVLSSGTFISGDWRIASVGQEHINGFFYIFKNDLMSINGFNEYITTYGWDDDDLFNRLEANNLLRKRVDARTIYHQPHNDEQRVGPKTPDLFNGWDELETIPQFKIQRNRFISNVMPAWNKSRPMLTFEILTCTSRSLKLVRKGPSKHYVPEHILRDSAYYTARTLLVWKYGLIALDLTNDQLDNLLYNKLFSHVTCVDIASSLNNNYSNSKEFPINSYHSNSPSINKNRLKLFIDAQHGLGNRLRAIGSASAIAEATGRELVIVWEPDHHCDCNFRDLFDYKGCVIEERFLEDILNKYTVYNYMETENASQKNEEISTSINNEIYIRSAFVLNHPSSTWNKENEFIKSLTPVDAVKSLLSSIPQNYELGAHIRMVGGNNYQHLEYESISNWTKEGHNQIDHWRKKSHYNNFIKRIDFHINSGKVNKLFLAADLPITYEVFIKYYKDKLTYLPRTLYDRSVMQLQHALADAILLSKSHLLLGSTWSSFSELAIRLASNDQKIEMSGTDF